MTWVPDPDSQGYAMMNGKYRICKSKVRGKWIYELWIYGGDMAWDQFISRGSSYQEMQAAWERCNA